MITVANYLHLLFEIKMESTVVEKYLDYKSDGSFSSLSNFAKKFRKSKRNIVSEALHSLPEYTRYVPRKIRFHRRKTISYRSNDIWVMDLMDVSKYARLNKGYKYILVVIDAHSKKLFCEPLKNKRGDTVSSALRDIIKKNKEVAPQHFFSDQGKYLIAFANDAH